MEVDQGQLFSVLLALLVNPSVGVVGLENVVDLSNSVIECLTDVVQETGDLQEVRELHLDLQGLQQEHDGFEIDNFMVLAGLTFVDHELGLEHLGSFLSQVGQP